MPVFPRPEHLVPMVRGGFDSEVQEKEDEKKTSS